MPRTPDTRTNGTAFEATTREALAREHASETPHGGSQYRMDRRAAWNRHDCQIPEPGIPGDREVGLT